MKNYIIAFFCLIVSYGFSQNCTYTLQGTVVDFHDGSVIENATVYLKNTQKFTATNATGKFSFTNLCESSYVLVISHIGCKTIEREINLKANFSGKFNLEHHSEELEEVTVVGKTTSKNTNSFAEAHLATKTLERYSSGSLGDALKEVSGVSSINTGNAIVKPMIHGLHSSRIITVNNGVRLQDQEWGIEHAPNIDLNTSESISVIKGAGALAYGGDAIGGVIVLNTKKPILVDSIYGRTLTGFQDNGRAYNISSSLTKNYANGWFFQANGSYKRFGDYKAPDYYLTNTGSESYAFSLEGGFKSFKRGWNIFVSSVHNEIGILSASHIGAIQDLVNAINAPEPLIQDDFSYQINLPKQEVRHLILKAQYYQRFERLGKLTVQYDFQENNRLEFDKRLGENRFKPAVDLNLITHSFTSDFLFDSDNSWKVQTGGLFRFQKNFPDPATGVRRLIPDYKKFEVGFYTAAKHQFSDNWTFDVGFRYDFTFNNVKKFYLTSRWESLGYNVLFPHLVIREEGTQLLTNPKLTFHNIAFSVGTTYRLTDSEKILVNYTHAKRPPNISELFSDGLHHSAARIELGDLQFTPESSNRFSLSYQSQKKGFSLDADAYVNMINNYIFLMPTGAQQTIRGSFPVWNYRQVNAIFAGIDLSTEFQFSDNWKYTMRTSYIYGQDKKNNIPIIDMPPFQIRNSIGYTNKKWSNFSSTIESEWVGKQTRFPNFNFLQYIPELDREVLVDISTPPNAYHLVHLRNSINLNWFTKTNTKLSFNIQNIFNTSYRNYLNRLRYFANEVGRTFQIQLKITY